MQNDLIRVLCKNSRFSLFKEHGNIKFGFEDRELALQHNFETVTKSRIHKSYSSSPWIIQRMV